jgi:hypothetical protein
MEASCSDWLCWKTAYRHRWSTREEYYSGRACRCNTAISWHLKIPSAYVRPFVIFCSMNQQISHSLNVDVIFLQRVHSIFPFSPIRHSVKVSSIIITFQKPLLTWSAKPIQFLFLIDFYEFILNLTLSGQVKHYLLPKLPDFLIPPTILFWVSVRIVQIKFPPHRTINFPLHCFLKSNEIKLVFINEITKTERKTLLPHTPYSSLWGLSFGIFIFITSQLGPVMTSLKWWLLLPFRRDFVPQRGTPWFDFFPILFSFNMFL